MKENNGKQNVQRNIKETCHAESYLHAGTCSDIISEREGTNLYSIQIASDVLLTFFSGLIDYMVKLPSKAMNFSKKTHKCDEF